MGLPLILSDGRLSAVVRPEFGAGLARLDYLVGGQSEALLRPGPVEGAANPFDLALQVLVPWSNRISSGGFAFAGRRVELSPNVAGEPFPIHGNGFSLPWEVISATATSATLRLLSDGPGCFRYAAELTYSISSGQVTIDLEVRNTGSETLPFGLGFHPWFVRTPATQLEAHAGAVWLETPEHLPAGRGPVQIPPAWDFSKPTNLPDGFINNCFVHWDRRALINWPDRRLGVEITASRSLGNYILYSPSGEADFICFEPVGHPVDAFNMPGAPEGNGLVVLAPGQATSAWVTMRAGRSE